MRKRERDAMEAGRWAHIAEKLVRELTRYERRAAGPRVSLLRLLHAAALGRDGETMVTVGAEYVRRFRVPPPGVYALAYGPGRTLYLDGERLEPRVRVAGLRLGVVHAQIYR